MRILVVDDDEVTRELLRELLGRSGFVVTLAASGEAAVAAIREKPFQLVLSDIRMVELDGMAVLREARRRDPSAAVILMTGFGSMRGAVDALKAGAFDYVSKPFAVPELMALVQRAAKHRDSLEEMEEGAVPGTHGRSREGHRGAPLIGKSPKIVEVYRMIARAALSESGVLVSGEKGTGKRMVARGIHDSGSRRQGRFQASECASCELDAASLPKGGTLFLDELADLPHREQAKLSQILAGGGRPAVRVIAATRWSPEALLDSGKIREDLYYKIRVIPIPIPPLRDRMEDLPELVAHFLARHGKRVSHVSEECLGLFRAYRWPGNVRELEHRIESAVALTSSRVLEAEDFQEIREAVEREDGKAAREAGHAAGDGIARSVPASLEEMEKAQIGKVLKDTGFNKSRASEILGIDRVTLYRKAQRYGIPLRP